MNAKTSQDSYYKPLTSEESIKAFKNEFDFDHADAIDFDRLVNDLRDIKEGWVSHLVSSLGLT